MSTCLVCQSNAGTQRISPGPAVHRGRFWLVEHAYPTSLLGWLVIVLRRHAEGLHELTEDEATELGTLQRMVARVLHAKVATVKEYAMCFGEGEGFSHLHVHMVPRAAELEESLRGRGILDCLMPERKPLAPETVAAFCEELQGMFGRQH